MQYHITHKTTIILIFIITLLLSSKPSIAQNSAEYIKQDKGGSLLQVSSGDYSMVFTEIKSWTFRDLIYKGIVLTYPNGSQQAVLREKETPEGVDTFLGTGHRREQIESIEVISYNSSGEVINSFPVKEGLKIIEGDSYVVRKKSKFHSEVGGLYYLHEANITISSEGIEQDFKFKAVADDYSNIDFMYAFMHMFNKKFSTWLAGDNNNVIDRGVFLSNRSFTLKKDIRYLLVYNPKDSIGVAIIYPEIYQGTRNKNTFWNRANDSKHYLQVNPIKTKGEEFAYSAKIKIYEAKDATAFETVGHEIVKREISTHRIP